MNLLHSAGVMVARMAHRPDVIAMKTDLGLMLWTPDNTTLTFEIASNGPDLDPAVQQHFALVQRLLQGVAMLLNATHKGEALAAASHMFSGTPGCHKQMLDDVGLMLWEETCQAEFRDRGVVAQLLSTLALCPQRRSEIDRLGAENVIQAALAQMSALQLNTETFHTTLETLCDDYSAQVTASRRLDNELVCGF